MAAEAQERTKGGHGRAIIQFVLLFGNLRDHHRPIKGRRTDINLDVILVTASHPLYRMMFSQPASLLSCGLVLSSSVNQNLLAESSPRPKHIQHLIV